MSIYEPPGTEVPDDVLEAQERAALADQGGAHLTVVPDTVDLHDETAEAALLGAAMLSTTARDVLATLQPTDFYVLRHQVIAAAIQALHDDGQPTDLITVADQLQRLGHLELAGGPPALINLQSSVPATTTAPRYASIVRHYSTLRAIQTYGTEIHTLASRPGAQPSDLAAQAQNLLDRLHDQANAGTSRLANVTDLLDDYIDRLAGRSEQDLAGVTTGLVDLDNAIGGLQPGRLYTIAGRPGMGKSDIGIAIARAAARAGHRTHVASIEMGTDEVIDRWVAAGSHIASTAISNGRLGDNDWPHITSALAELGDWPLTIDDDPSTGVGTIRADARKTGAELVVVDYVQIVDTIRAESRQIEVTALARALKRLARDLQVPVIILAQLNRGPEGRINKRPMLADLRESGAIEQESDVVIGLYRDEQYDPDTKDRGVMELILMKNRTGPMKTVRVAYLPDVKIIANIAGAN